MKLEAEVSNMYPSGRDILGDNKVCKDILINSIKLVRDFIKINEEEAGFAYVISKLSTL